MYHFLHVLNPYACAPDGEAYLVQQRTLESLAAAAAFADGVVRVSFVIRADPADAALPAGVAGLPNRIERPLARFACDLKSFEVPRRLPVLSDLLDLELPSDDRAFVVYTNMDICTSPFFYTECVRMLKDGADCMVINRRTVDKGYLERPLNEGFVAESTRHPGHDCFVMPASFLARIRPPDTILGIGFVFRPLLLACILHHGRRFVEHADAYLTMHFGDDMEWKNPRFNDYLEHNRDQLIAAWRSQEPRIRELRRDAHVDALIAKHFPFSFLK